MCDTLARVEPDGTWFAKSSDRPPSEVQLVRSFPRRAGGGRLRTQYLELADPGAAAITLAGQPTWLWGFETGINEHRVAIGNETVYTTDDRWSAPRALLGMDLVRLTLERATTAAAARGVLTDLLEQHGQGGSAWEHRDEPYFSSFLVADPTEAWVVETSARSWVARRFDAGGVAISNRLSLASDWDLASPDVAPGTDWQTRRDPKAPTGIADHRRAVTAAAADAPADLATLVAALRDHGPTHPALPGDVGADWSGVTVCMHVRGYQATTSSAVAWLPADPATPVRQWACLGSPCVSVYVPVEPAWSDLLADPTTWQRFAALRDRVEADPSGADELAVVRAVLDPVEAEVWAGAAGPTAVGAALDALGV